MVKISSSRMGITCLSFLLTVVVLMTTIVPRVHALTPLPYLSPTTLFSNYENMFQTFKIFIYKPQNQMTLSFASPSQSLFYSSLSSSHFVTLDPHEAHLFFLPFSSHLSSRSIARLVKDLRTQLPFWNQTLGADHFYLSCHGIGYESDRNLVELKKNSVQISCFPTIYGKFIPHKDVTLPALNSNRLPLSPLQHNSSAKFLGFFRFHGQVESTLINELNGDAEFIVESEPFDEKRYVENMLNSRFCLFEYDRNVTGIGEALSMGCVPVVMTDRPIQDLPLMDVLMWSDIALFVGSGVGVEELKNLLGRTCSDSYERMRLSGVVASMHFGWNQMPQPYDAFHMVMYQLWLRRHTIRYARWEGL